MGGPSCRSWRGIRHQPWRACTKGVPNPPKFSSSKAKPPTISSSQGQGETAQEKTPQAKPPNQACTDQAPPSAEKTGLLQLYPARAEARDWTIRVSALLRLSRPLPSAPMCFFVHVTSCVCSQSSTRISMRLLVLVLPLVCGSSPTQTPSCQRMYLLLVLGQRCSVAGVGSPCPVQNFLTSQGRRAEAEGILTLRQHENATRSQCMQAQRAVERGTRQTKKPTRTCGIQHLSARQAIHRARLVASFRAAALFAHT